MVYESSCLESNGYSLTPQELCMSTPNQLIHEKSPYLLQHAYNPVNWYPWGEEAFKKAQEMDKPIFLSIGYATCHWCHVMEHESFMNERIATLMNETFINIKVDREERPDIDGVYMSVSQMLTGGGGWPLTIIMTPEKKPFYSGTYIPPETRYNRIGMMELIPRIKEYWVTERDRVESIGESITESFTQSITGSEDITPDVFDTAFLILDDTYDEENGGFGSAPKFPLPHNIMFLLRYYYRTGKEKALAMAEKTLQSMSLGGIYDQIGYGFHRYSTDEKWLVPHFEKMLYDQAMLVMAYTETYQITKKPCYKRTVIETIKYVARKLTHPIGGFYSAEDADSDGEEGKFYLWDTIELDKLLSKLEYEKVIETYNVSSDGNYLDEATARKTSKNILYLKARPSEDEVLHSAQDKLFTARESRSHPLLDDKILTDWNGLMIAALSKAGRAFQDKEYIEHAVAATDFINDNMWDGSTLLHRYREGEAGIPGFLNDYAFFTWGLIELYQATNDKRYLENAVALTEATLKGFNDPLGGLFFTSDKSEKLLARRKEVYDGAIPSGNSVVYYNLLRLWKILGDTRYLDEAMRISKFFSSRILGQPNAYTMFLVGLDFVFGSGSEVVLTGKSEETATFFRRLSEEYLPNSVIQIWSRELAEDVSYIGELPGNQSAIYVCRDFSCYLPTDNIENALKIIKQRRD